MPLNQLASLDSHGVFTYQGVPKNQLDIFYRDIKEFIPEGKTWETMSKEEKETAAIKYRFDFMLPSVYQGITGISSATGEVAGS